MLHMYAYEYGRQYWRTFHRWGGLVFIVDDHDNFPNWIMILNSMFPNWMVTLKSMFPSRRMIQCVSHWIGFSCYYQYRIW